MWRTKRLLLLPAAVAAAAVAALAALIALTLPASPAGANHVAGATYVGTHSGGGTVEFLVSPDGAGIESFKATNLTGFFCKINQSTHSWDPPLAIDHTLDPAFIDINFVGLSIRGSFPSAGTAEGLVSGIVPPPLGCTSDVFEWTATTAELPTPPPTPTPTPLEPDLVALKTAAPLAVFPGGAITYKVRITNEGESEAQGVQAEDMLPPDVSFVSDTCQGDASNGMWALDIGTLAPGGAVQCFLDVAVSPDAEGQFDPERRQLILENVVSASTSSEESSLGNNTAMAEVVLQHSCPPHGQRQKTGDVNDDGIDDWFLGTFTFTDIDFELWCIDADPAASGDEHFELHTGDHAICACVFDGGQNQFFPDVTDEGELERLSWRNFDDGSGGAGDPTDDDHDGKLDEVWYVWEPAPPGSLVLVHREDGAVVENGIMIIPTPSTSGDLFGIALDFVGATGDPLCTLDAEGQDNEAFGQLVEELLGAPGEPTPTATSTPTNTPTPTATPEKAAGDVNDDGQVTSVDAALVLQLAAGLVPSLPNEPSGDVDLNGSLTAVDAALILQFVAGLIPGLPV